MAMKIEFEKIDDWKREKLSNKHRFYLFIPSIGYSVKNFFVLYNLLTGSNQFLEMFILLSLLINALNE